MVQQKPKQLLLKDLIEALEVELQKGDRQVPIGFGNAHSYRGYYSELAFEVIENVSISSILKEAKWALGGTYEGWKGGEFVMTENTPCWLAEEGCTGEMLGAILLTLILK